MEISRRHRLEDRGGWEGEGNDHAILVVEVWGQQRDFDDIPVFHVLTNINKMSMVESFGKTLTDLVGWWVLPILIVVIGGCLGK